MEWMNLNPSLRRKPIPYFLGVCRANLSTTTAITFHIHPDHPGNLFHPMIEVEMS